MSCAYIYGNQRTQDGHGPMQSTVRVGSGAIRFLNCGRSTVPGHEAGRGGGGDAERATAIIQSADMSPMMIGPLGALLSCNVSEPMYENASCVDTPDSQPCHLGSY